MSNRLQKEIVYRSVYLTLASVALLSSLGIFTLGGGKSAFDVFFFQNYFNLPLVLTIPFSAVALKEDWALLRENRLGEYAKKCPFWRFAGFTASVFGLVMGTLFVGRVGDQYLKEGLSYAAIYPGIITARFWTDLSVLLSRLICPALYIAGYILFDGRGQLKKYHAQLGIMPPTWFYMINKIFGKQYIKYLGGAEAAKAAGKYARGAAYFFYDDVTFYQKWWPFAWLAIFGVFLVVMNKLSWKLAMTERKGEKSDEKR